MYIFLHNITARDEILPTKYFKDHFEISICGLGFHQCGYFEGHYCKGMFYIQLLNLISKIFSIKTIHSLNNYNMNGILLAYCC